MESPIDCVPGKILKIYVKKDMWIFEKLWMSTFCKNKQGLNTKSYKWHIFSGDGHPSTTGEKALNEYQSQVAPEFIVMANDDELAVATDELPQSCNLSDFYVFPKNMAWTMAFTHEDGWLGPYFAKHPDYEYLNSENIRIIEKNRQIEMAKSKGWL